MVAAAYIKLGRHASRTLHAAHRAGIDLEFSHHGTPTIEQEQADIS